MGDQWKRPFRDGTSDSPDPTDSEKGGGGEAGSKGTSDYGKAARVGRRGDGEPLPLEAAYDEDGTDDATTARRRKLAFAAVALLVGYAPPKDPTAAAAAADAADAAEGEEGQEEGGAASDAAAAWAGEDWAEILGAGSSSGGAGEEEEEKKEGRGSSGTAVPAYDLEVTGSQVVTLLNELLRLGEGSTLVLLLTLCRRWVKAADQAEDQAYQKMMMANTMESTVVAVPAADDDNANNANNADADDEEKGAEGADGGADGGANGGKPGGVTVKLVFPTTGSNGSMRERNLFTQQTALLEAVVRLKFWRRASDVVATAANQKAHKAKKRFAAAKAAYNDAKQAYKDAKKEDDDAYEALKADAAENDDEDEEPPARPDPSEATVAARAARDAADAARTAANEALREAEQELSEEWALFDESPRLAVVGAPGSTRHLPLNYVRPLAVVLNEAALLGDTGDADDPTLASHAVDSLADAALFLWQDVAQPLLAHLDSAAASAPLAPPPSPLPGRRGYSAAFVMAEEAANRGGDDGRGGGAPGAAALTGGAPDVSTMGVLDPDTPPDPLDVPTLATTLLACRAAMGVARVDDPVLLATVALRAGLVLGEPTLGDDLRRAVQVIRGALNDIDDARTEFVLPHLHKPNGPDDVTCLHRASITMDVDDDTAAACERRLGAGGYGGNGIYGAGSVLDPLHQTIASLHVDMYSLLFRLELRLANKLAKTGALKRHRAEVKAARAARAKEAKRGGGGGSKGGASTVAGGTTVLSGAALTGVLTGGASAMGGHGGHGAARFDPLHAEPVVPKLVSNCEARLMAEVKKHPHLKALLLIEVATLRARTGTGQPFHSGAGGYGALGGGAVGSGGGALLEGLAGASFPAPPAPPAPYSPLGLEIAKMLKEAQICLEEAVAKEEALLTKAQPQWEDYPKQRPLFLSDEDRAAATSESPPAPAVLHRCDRSISVLPRRWFPAAPAEKKKNGRGGGNSGSTKKLKPAAPPEVAYYRVFGKEAGAGTDVTLNNSALLGTAEVIPYDASTGTAARAALIRDLTPNEAYVFAVAAYDKDDNVLGKIGPSTVDAPAEAMNPLPTRMCRGYLATSALRLGCDSVAKGAALQVVKSLCSSQHLTWALPIDEGGINDGISGNVGGGTGRYAAPLNAYIMANLLIKPSDLDRCPRSDLLSLAQCLLVAAEVARRSEDALVADSNADAGTMLLPADQEAAAQSNLAVTAFLGKSTAHGASSAAAQQNQLQRLNQITLAVEIAALLKDVPLLQRSAHLAYDNLRPLLSLASMSIAKSGGAAASVDGGLHRHLFQSLTRLQQAYARVPTSDATKTDTKLRTLLAAGLAEAGLAIAEREATKLALVSGAITTPVDAAGGGSGGGMLADGRADDADTMATGNAPSVAGSQAKDAQDGKKKKTILGANKWIVETSSSQ